MLLRILTALCAMAITEAPSHAVCIYAGVLNAKTTIEREYKDARWVVRAHVFSADYHWSDEADSWTLYRLKLVHEYKGKAPQRFEFYTLRDSGGFYLDGEGATPDFKRDYLLFLLPPSAPGAEPLSARQATRINYACGRSKPWSEVTATDAEQLRKLSARQQR